MTRSLKLLGLSALAALILVARNSAAGQPTEGISPQADALKKVEQQLDGLDQKMKGLVDTLNLELKKISDAINGHNKRVNTLEANDADTTLKVVQGQRKIERLEKQVDKLRLDMEMLQKRTSSVALYPPPEKASLDEIRAQLAQIQQALNRLQTTTQRPAIGAAPTGVGRIVLVNQHPETLLFVINQKSYRVTSGQTATIDNMPAGTFTYEVISPTAGTAGARTRLLAAGETYTLTARP